MNAGDVQETKPYISTAVNGGLLASSLPQLLFNTLFSVLFFLPPLVVLLLFFLFAITQFLHSFSCSHLHTNLFHLFFPPFGDIALYSRTLRSSSLAAVYEDFFTDDSVLIFTFPVYPRASLCFFSLRCIFISSHCIHACTHPHAAEHAR